MNFGVDFYSTLIPVIEWCLSIPGVLCLFIRSSVVLLSKGSRFSDGGLTIILTTCLLNSLRIIGKHLLNFHKKIGRFWSRVCTFVLSVQTLQRFVQSSTTCLKQILK